MRKGIIDQSVLTNLSGSEAQVLYGSPKTNMDGEAMRPILSRINLPYHEFAHFLVEFILAMFNPS